MSTRLNTEPNFHRAGQRPAHPYSPGDEFYERLIATHRGLSDDQSRVLNARLVLLLANHVGDLGVLEQALAAARAGVAPPGDDPEETS
jgi:hypothetical protein